MNLNFLNNALSSFFILMYNPVQAVFQNKNISYGLTIILFTLVIKIILLPLNIKQIRSQIKMSEVQPLTKKIQEKYKKDPKKSQEEVMKLYKEKGVNPLGGCLPLLIQLPILWALFYVFRTLPNIQGVSFLWIPNLAAPDYQFFGVVRILPILSGITQYFSTLMMTPAGAAGDNPQMKQQGTMNIGMSIFMVFMSWNFTSALVLYWVTNNLLQILQMWGIKKLETKKVVE